MFCTNCGKELQDDMSFCPYCGKSTGGVAPRRKWQLIRRRTTTGHREVTPYIVTAK